MRKNTFLLTFITAFLLLALPAEAKENYIIEVNGKQQSLVPVIQNKIVMLPLVQTAKALKLSAKYDSRQKSYTLSGNGKTYAVYRNSDKVLINKKVSHLKGKVQTIQKIDRISLESLVGLFGLITKTDQAKHKIIINQKSYKPSVSPSKSAGIAPSKQSTQKTAVPASQPSAVSATGSNNQTTIPELSANNVPAGSLSSEGGPEIKTGGGNALMPQGKNQSPGPIIQRPSSFIGYNEMERAKRRIQDVSWAKAYGSQIQKKSKTILNEDMTAPAKAGGHTSWYVCKNGMQLQYQNGRHYCPSDKQYYSGEKYDAAWRTFKNNELIQNTRLLAESYALYGNEKDAEAAKNILIQYADAYPSFSTQEKGGKLYYQSLDEAVSAVDLATAYDLVYKSTNFSDKDKHKIESQLLRPMADAIRKYPMGRSNWQAWHDAAIGAIGAAVQDRALIDEAVNGPLGFYYLMNNGVLADGFWWEGSMAYHTYSLAPLTILAQTASHWGYDLYSSPKLKLMFDIPLLYSYPNFVMPANNDGGKYGTSLIGFTSPRGYNDYEAAYAYYKDPNYGWLLNEKYKTLSRNGDFALFFGADKIDDGEREALRSYNLSSIGHAILRNPDNTEDQNYLLLDYGEFGGAHGHYDKLAIDYYGAGSMLAPDFGTPIYSHPLYRSWYKQTISHNTVTVDGKSQQESAGKMILFSSQPFFKHLYAAANSVYNHVIYERGIWMDDDYTLDWFYLNDPNKSHQYDWTLHGLGTYQTNLPLRQAVSLGNSDGYEQLKSIKTASAENCWEGTWSLGENFLRVSSIPFSTSQVSIAQAPGPSNEPDKLTTMLIQRKTEKEAQIVTILQPFEGANKFKVTGEREGLNAVKIYTSKGIQHLYQNYQALKNGQLAAAKGETAINSAYDMKANVKSFLNGSSVNIQVKDLGQFSRLSLAFYAPGAAKAAINNSNVSFIKQGDFILIDYRK
ncbi:heparinase II/III domain-containing protein [Metabacillus sp. RGM 3146]|uniref:heparinase II/III domain-containing protein n=1 Tax=Metabacillus sp. RGM 3146 TaxID=3401092 RepID=UPI003B9C8989